MRKELYSIFDAEILEEVERRLTGESFRVVQGNLQKLHPELTREEAKKAAKILLKPIH